LQNVLNCNNTRPWPIKNSSVAHRLRNPALDQWCKRWGCRRCKRTPKSFDLLKIRAKSLKIWAKSVKIWAKSLKIWAKMAPKICRKTSEDHFFAGHTTKTVGNSCTTTFWASLENLAKNPLHPQKFACSNTYALDSIILAE